MITIVINNSNSSSSNNNDNNSNNSSQDPWQLAPRPQPARLPAVRARRSH